MMNDTRGVLSDACMLVTCCVTNERWKITCSVTHVDNLTMLCREEVLKRTSLFHMHAKFKSCPLMNDAVCTASAFSLVNGCNTSSEKHVFVVLDGYFPALRTLLSARVSNVALSGGCRVRPSSRRMSFSSRRFFFLMRRSSGFALGDICTIL